MCQPQQFQFPAYFLIDKHSNEKVQSIILTKFGKKPSFNMTAAERQRVAALSIMF